jgi:uncharacterized protein DUF4865
VHVMQYEIGLPLDYDMGIIERRVAARGSSTDGFPHLGLKAYAVRRAGRYGSTVNAYAPFYFWRDPAGMNSFLYGPFRSITTDFGRPPVRHWVGAAFHAGPDFGAAPVFATRTSTFLPPDIEPTVDVSPSRGIHSEAIAVDPATWEIVRFTLWATRPSGRPENATAFDVLHASTPFLKDLPTGRLWPEP